MAETTFTEYKFTVKEGNPSESGGEAPTFLACEPLTERPSILADSFMSFALNEGTTIETAHEIARFLQQHITGISITTF